jgi:hypothetical protein
LSLSQHWISRLKWIIFTMYQLKNWVLLRKKSLQLSQHWTSHQKWILFKINASENWAHFERSLYNSSQHWISYQKWIFFMMYQLKNWVLLRNKSLQFVTRLNITSEMMFFKEESIREFSRFSRNSF